MNAPNLLSLARVALMPIILLALRHGWEATLLALMLLAAATDLLDGLLARKLGQVSALGKVLDPLADKICINSMAVALSLWRDFPWWATGLIVGRDLLILLGGLLLLNKTRVVPTSNWPGKTAATLLAGVLIFYSMRWQPWGQYLLIVALAAAAASGASYLTVFAKRTRKP